MKEEILIIGPKGSGGRLLLAAQELNKHVGDEAVYTIVTLQPASVEVLKDILQKKEREGK